MSSASRQFTLGAWTPTDSDDPFEAIPGGVHHVPRFTSEGVEFVEAVSSECSACHGDEACALHHRLSSSGDGVLRVVEANGHTKVMLTRCPACVDGERCNVDLTGRTHTSDHIAEHAPEDFDLSPLRDDVVEEGGSA